MALRLDSWRPGRRATVACAAVLFGLGALPSAQPETAAAPSACGLTTADRVVAIADVHGAYDRFVGILRAAGLIDAQNHWAGGKAIFVQTGDILDRGPDSRRALDLIRTLETEAPKAGGRVVPLLGNHEVMRMTGDFRYISSGEYAAFATPASAAQRDRLFQSIAPRAAAQARNLGEPFNEADFRKVFETQTPLGAIEMQIAFAASGEYGSWLRTHDTVALVNGVAFLHGGLNPETAALGCAGINSKIRAQLRTAKVTDAGFYDSLLGAIDGPHWYRGMLDTPESPVDLTDESVTTVLRSLRARAIVVGHTVAPDHTDHVTFNGRVYQIDTGMLGGEYYRDGVASALEIKDDTFTAIYVDRREVLFKSGARLTGGRQSVPPGAARR